MQTLIIFADNESFALPQNPTALEMPPHNIISANTALKISSHGKGS